MELSLILAAVAAVAFALIQGMDVRRIQITDPRITEIGGYIHAGAMAYLGRQYRVLVVFVAVLAAIITFTPGLGLSTALAFVLGALFSVVAGFCGMKAATAANMRTAQAAGQGQAQAFRAAFSGGSVMGLMVVGLGALGIGIVYLLNPGNLGILTGFSLGASSIALFCRVGGGIYTKAADVGADLVGKVEAGIPEDDPRNPAVIADNVGDNVGDVAGMGSDLFESYVGCIVSALLLAVAWGGTTALPYVLGLVAAGILSSMLGILVVSLVKTKDAQLTLNLGTYLSSILLVADAFLLGGLLPEGDGTRAFAAVVSGIAAGLLIGKLTETYTSDQYKAVKEIAGACTTGAATNILTGLSYGMLSTAWPILVLAGATLASYAFCGTFGIALAAVGMLATVGMVISVDAYGPVADNAGGIAEMSGQPDSVREITDHLDSVGNTTAAIGKGFSIGSAALTALALFASYALAVELTVIDILNPRVMAGLLIGGMLSFLFSALTISSVSRAANKMIDEVRRQFREFPGIMAGTQKPDYAKCVDISTQAAIREMILPGVIAIASPIAVGLLLGKEALAGLLAGATVTGVLMAVMMANAGGAWDNAKKYIEGGSGGGKGSEAHKAAVIGDTVGDPLKDTAGPSINILIKLMSMVALVFAPLFL
ncbi:MAG: sodium-translocating pyrophosphatase [Angelakisella sp.]|jgi:K(+)-stimulated pyrophosphate-energized sodium pump|nr:sodium-translocating pyrophosphatase [Angelakisella sp.]